MLKYLKLQNVGPAEEMELELGSRLNILTGDNGLGKSFLLDVAWHNVTGLWPKEVNPSLTMGYKILPKDKDSPSKIEFPGTSILFNRSAQTWIREGETAKTLSSNNKYEGICIYMMADGSCAVFDPYRNVADEAMKEKLPPSYVFNPSEILNELKSSKDGTLLSNGLIRDWASWQKENGLAFEILKSVLANLSPSKENAMKPGQLTRIDLNDVRDMPTIEMPYEGKVPVVHASSGIRRIVTFAYILVWTWVEHLRAADIRGKVPLINVLFLIDEVDAHLHPSWQRKIIPSILKVMEAVLDGMAMHYTFVLDIDNMENKVNRLERNTQIQLIATTHSPLIMASLEPLFDPETDAWFDLDLVGENGHRKVELQKREFEIRGDANKWLMSKAFDLQSSRSEEAETVLERAAKALEQIDFPRAEVDGITSDLIKYLPAGDVFLAKWDMLGRKKGWWA